MVPIKLFLIRLADWIDAILLQHRFYAVCKRVSESSWWGDETEGWVKREDG